MKNRRIALQYLFREHTIYTLLFTLLSAGMLIQYGIRSYLFIFWLKVVGFVGVTAIYYLSRKKQLYFFYNLGLNTRDLLLFSLSIDIVVSLTILIITHTIAH